MLETIEDYWEDSGMSKPRQVVVCAACKEPVSGLVICSARHWDNQMRLTYSALHMAFKERGTGRWEQGFIDQFGTFLTREEAMIVALAANQPIDIERGCGGDNVRLYSEGLY